MLRLPKDERRFMDKDDEWFDNDTADDFDDMCVGHITDYKNIIRLAISTHGSIEATTQLTLRDAERKLAEEAERDYATEHADDLLGEVNKLLRDKGYSGLQLKISDDDGESRVQWTDKRASHALRYVCTGDHASVPKLFKRELNNYVFQKKHGHAQRASYIIEKRLLGAEYHGPELHAAIMTAPGLKKFMHNAFSIRVHSDQLTSAYTNFFGKNISLSEWVKQVHFLFDPTCDAFDQWNHQPNYRKVIVFSNTNPPRFFQFSSSMDLGDAQMHIQHVLGVLPRFIHMKPNVVNGDGFTKLHYGFAEQ
jgi:hypothetical protein